MTLGTCINVLDYKLSVPEVQGILSIIEILQIIAFFSFIFHLQKLCDITKKEKEKLICRISEYSIVIRRIPNDTTKEQLISHFNSLYPLNVKDWSGREPVGRYMNCIMTISVSVCLYIDKYMHIYIYICIYIQLYIYAYI